MAAPESDAPKAPSPRNAPRTKPPEPRRPPWASLATGLAGLLLLLAFEAGVWRETTAAAIGYTQFYAWVEAGKVESLTLDGREATGSLKASEKVDGRDVKAFRTTLPAQDDRDLLPLLRDKHVDVRATAEHQSQLASLLVSLLPWALILGAWWWISRRAAQSLAGGAGGPLGGLMRGKTRRFEPQEDVRIRFDDVAGLQSAKADLREVVEFLREPARFQKLGGKLPRGVLLIGPPGTGKTLLARAVAGEAGVPFFYVNGSEFIQIFVGIGASRVRELFDEAKKAAPAIVFIDEVDAVGRTRGAGIGGVNDEREQTLNQLLSEMDGFSHTDNVIVLAATNRPDVLDAALLRPGRFDRHVPVERPESKAREAILKVHVRGIPLAPDVRLEGLAQRTAGFSGADLANLANEAALHAARRAGQSVDARDFAAAMDKIVLGDPRETLLDPDERRRVASHESGHAIVAWFTERAEPLQRVSILPRGMALGATQQTPALDRHLATRSLLEAKLRVLLGGYAAESLLLGEVSSGSENDLREATKIAFSMVAQYGMSEALGPMFHEQCADPPSFGRGSGGDRVMSDATTRVIEQETRRVLGEAADGARRTLSAHRSELDCLIEALLEQETLERDAVERVIASAVATAGGTETSSVEPQSGRVQRARAAIGAGDEPLV
jgi:cell division protease FtsH